MQHYLFLVDPIYFTNTNFYPDIFFDKCYAEEITKKLGIDSKLLYYEIRALLKAGELAVKEVAERNGNLSKIYKVGVYFVSF